MNFMLLFQRVNYCYAIKILYIQPYNDNANVLFSTEQASQANYIATCFNTLTDRQAVYLNERNN